MRRSLLALLGVAVVAWIGTSVVQAADSPDLRTIGIDAYPEFGQNQPSTIGDFTGRVGQALFSLDAKKGDKQGFSHFEADMRFMQGAAKDPTTGRTRGGSWGLT